MKNGGGGNGGTRFLFFRAKRGSDEHARTHEAVVADFDANLSRAQVGVEDGADVADDASYDFVGIRVQADLGFLTELHVGQVVFKHVAENPEGAQIGNGEGIGSAQPGNAGGIGD